MQHVWLRLRWWNLHIGRTRLRWQSGLFQSHRWDWSDLHESSMPEICISLRLWCLYWPNKTLQWKKGLSWRDRWTFFELSRRRREFSCRLPVRNLRRNSSAFERKKCFSESASINADLVSASKKKKFVTVALIVMTHRTKKKVYAWSLIARNMRFVVAMALAFRKLHAVTVNLIVLTVQMKIIFCVELLWILQSSISITPGIFCQDLANFQPEVTFATSTTSIKKNICQEWTSSTEILLKLCALEGLPWTSASHLTTQTLATTQNGLESGRCFRNVKVNLRNFETFYC